MYFFTESFNELVGSFLLNACQNISIAQHRPEAMLLFSKKSFSVGNKVYTAAILAYAFVTLSVVCVRVCVVKTFEIF